MSEEPVVATSATTPDGGLSVTGTRYVNAEPPVLLQSGPGERLSVVPDTVWGLDPVQLALDGSAWRPRNVLPAPFCIEVGRRLLLAELEFSEWILRRVEKIDLSRDRSVSRKIALEFSLRDDAPTFVLADGQRLRLIPLSLMRRRTLVNLKLEDGSGNTVLMPGLRLTQQLDQAVLLAAAVELDPEFASDPRVLEFVQLAVAGELPQVVWAFDTFDLAQDGPLARLRESDLFRLVANRLRHNFSLYTFVRVPKGAYDGGQRLMRLAFDEPIAWGYQTPQLKEDPSEPGVYDYCPGKVSRLTFGKILTAVGLKPIRVRFQVPGAECASSYHLEIVSPPGLQIVEATLLAGRPNDPLRHTSEDRVTGHTPVVGLHALEIPNGSLCRAQVDLGVPTRGWLAALWASSVAIFGVLLSVALHGSFSVGLNRDQITNVVLILVTTAAAAATIVTQQNGEGVAARFVTGLRALGTASIALPLVVAGTLVYSGLDGETSQRPRELQLIYLWAFTFVALAIGLILTAVSARSLWSQRRAIAKESPWDQTEFPRRREGRPEQASPPCAQGNFMASLVRFGFDKPAVGVRSAEGWFERYEWNDELQREAVAGLRRANPARRLPKVCTSVTDACGSGRYPLPRPPKTEARSKQTRVGITEPQ